eukprot:Selendium_serpulae@DN6406_c0_g5_i1.p1
MGIEFEEQFITKYGVDKVYVFDPTPKSVEFMRTRVALPQFEHRIEFTAEGLSTKSGYGDMLFPVDPKMVSGQLVELVDGERNATLLDRRTVKFGTLDQWMVERGHHWLDILKLDIEGAEYGVLESILSKGPPPFNQLVVEWHSRLTREGEIESKLIEKLKE